MKNNIINIGKSFLAKIIAFVGFYLCDIVLARGLCVDEYAEWSYFFSVVNIVLWISNFGISLTIRTIVAREECAENRKYYTNCGIILRFIVSAFFSALFFVFSNSIAVLSGWPEQYPDLLLLIRAGCVLPLFMAFVELWKDIFIGTGRLSSLVEMAVFEHIGYAGGCLIGILICENVRGALMGYYVGYITATFVGSFITKISFKNFVLSEKTKEDIVNIFKSAMPYVVTCVIAFVILEMDTVMIGMFRVGSSELANYSVAKKMIQKAVNVNEAFLYAVLPRFASVKKGENTDIYTTFKRIQNSNILITATVTIGIAVVLTKLVLIIYGAEYAQTKIFLIALLPVYFCNGVSQCYMQFLYYRAKAHIVSVCYASSFVINLIMNWVLIPKLGAMGAAIGTITSLIPFVIALVLFTFHEWKLINVTN